MSDSPEGPPPEEPKRQPPLATRFQKGRSGNPRGRPKGARNVVTFAFIKAIDRQWRLGGAQALETLRLKDPATFCKLVAQLVPQEKHVNVTGNYAEALRQIGNALAGASGDSPVEAGPEDLPANSVH